MVNSINSVVSEKEQESKDRIEALMKYKIPVGKMIVTGARIHSSFPIYQPNNPQIMSKLVRIWKCILKVNERVYILSGHEKSLCCALISVVH